MPTIVKNTNKTKEITYRVQYTYLDAQGKRKTKVETFEPPPGLKEQQAYDAAYAYGLSLEKKAKNLVKNLVCFPPDIKVKDLVEPYLTYLKKNRKLTHYKTTKDAFGFVVPKLGHHRIIDLTPLIIQNWIDYMDGQTYTLTRIVAKNLEAVMDEQKTVMSTLAKAIGCATNSVRKAKLGGNMSREIAEKIAYALKADINFLFDISETVIPYSYSMKDKALTALSGLLGFAIRNLIITDNYAEAKYVTGFEKNESGKEEKPYLEDYHIRDFLTKLQYETDIRRRVAASLAIMMGYRRGEIAGLEWADMDLSIGKITINRSSVVLSEFGIVEGTPKSKTSKRTSYMPPQLIAVLKDYKVWWNNFIMQLGDRYDGNQRLFLQITGKPLYPSTLYEWMRKLEKKYGLPIVSMHSVRGSSISMQKYSGLLSDEEVMKDAGHSDFQVTQDHYIKPFESEQKRIAVAKAKIFTVQGD